MKCNFESEFIPIPNNLFTILPKNEGFKVKYYSNNDEILCIRTEFAKLYSQNYTHVMNMPGNINQIMCAAKHFNIVCLDYRLTKYISEFCSKKLNYE